MGLLRKPVSHAATGPAVAIFSLHHSTIGKATQERPNTAAAHVRYITRTSACSRSFGARLPTDPAALTVWMNAAEAADRKNARLCDKLMLALPRELDSEERAALIEEFAEEVTVGRAAWFVAVHDRGKDAQNPHCHLLIRDRDPETGKRIMNTSERGSTERFREAWAAACNRALARAEQHARVTHLSLASQGIERTPTIHEGVRARRAAARSRPPKSRAVNARNAVTARSRTRRIDYPEFDGGQGRVAYNQEIVRQNEREYWAAIDDADHRRSLEQGHDYPGDDRFAPLPEFTSGFNREAWRAKRRAGRQRSRGRDFDDD